MRFVIVGLGLSLGCAALGSFDLLLVANGHSLHKYNGQTGTYLGHIPLPEEVGYWSSPTAYGANSEVAMVNWVSPTTSRITRYNYNTGAQLGSFVVGMNSQKIQYGPQGNLIVTGFDTASQASGSFVYSPSGALLGPLISVGSPGYRAKSTVQLSNGLYYQAGEHFLPGEIRSNRISALDSASNVSSTWLFGDAPTQADRYIGRFASYKDDLLVSQERYQSNGRMTLLRKDPEGNDLVAVNTIDFYPHGLEMGIGLQTVLLSEGGLGYFHAHTGAKHGYQRRIYRMNFNASTLALNDYFDTPQLLPVASSSATLVVVPEPGIVIGLGMGMSALLRRRKRR